MDLPDTITDGMMNAANFLHRSILWISGGRLGAELGSMPVVELRHTGRTSGTVRSTMLTAPIHDGDTFVLVASKGGDTRDPDWYRNIVANPDVELVVRGETLPMTARTVSDDERVEMWPRIVDAYSGYAGYQSKTERTIPVVLCEPRP